MNECLGYKQSLENKYDLKIFTDNIEYECLEQIETLLKQDVFKNCKMRIMPDTHAGKGCVIGFTGNLGDKVIPNIVGGDIGCFTGDTEVWLTSNYRTIKELADSNETFLIESYSEELGYFIYTNATAKKTRENADLIKVYYKSKSKFGYIDSVRCTLDHQFLVEELDGNKWIEAQFLEPDMKLKTEDTDIRVVNVEYLTEKEDVYCLTVPETHNFLIKDGIVVHNCGMLCANLGQVDINLKWLDEAIRNKVPSGRDSFESKHASFDKIKELYCFRDLKDTKLFEKQIGTLGGGNHFIELDKDEDYNHYLVIHTGSRNLGNQVATYYQNLAIELCSGKDEMYKRKDELIKTYKEQGRRSEIQDALKQLELEYKNRKPSIPNELCYLTGEYRDKYLHDMKICQEYAMLNRLIICGTILNEIFGKQSFTLVDETEIDIEKAKQYNVSRTIPYFQTIHNYLDFDDNIIRKGAIRANDGEKVIIPMNMRDGSLICIGRGNEEWNNSAPHGAGRLMSRSKAKENINIEEFKNSMKDIYTTSINESTIDEAPQVYKPMQEIIENIGDTVDIIKIIKPVYNFKASS